MFTAFATLTMILKAACPIQKIHDKKSSENKMFCGVELYNHRQFKNTQVCREKNAAKHIQNEMPNPIKYNQFQLKAGVTLM